MKHNVKYCCPHCPKVYGVYASLYSHKKVKHSEPSVACGSCFRRFHTHSQLYKHAFTSHTKAAPTEVPVTVQEQTTLAPVVAEKRRGSLAGFVFQESFSWGLGSQTPTTSVNSGLYREKVAQSWAVISMAIQKATMLPLKAACVKKLSALLSTRRQQLVHWYLCSNSRSLSSTAILWATKVEDSFKSVIRFLFK